MKGGSEDPFSTHFTGSITAKIGGSIMPIIDSFSGWEIVFRDLYTQYPCAGPFRVMKYLWRRRDFEGFYGVILTRNHKWSRRYRSW